MFHLFGFSQKQNNDSLIDNEYYGDENVHTLFITGGIGLTAGPSFAYGSSITFQRNNFALTALINGGEKQTEFRTPTGRANYRLYESVSGGMAIGLGYTSEYFSSSICVGLGYLETTIHHYTNKTPYSFYFDPKDNPEKHKTICVPIVLNLTGHGKKAGFTIQGSTFLSKRVEFRLLFGISLGRFYW